MRIIDFLCELLLQCWPPIFLTCIFLQDMSPQFFRSVIHCDIIESLKLPNKLSLCTAKLKNENWQICIYKTPKKQNTLVSNSLDKIEIDFFCDDGFVVTYHTAPVTDKISIILLLFFLRDEKPQQIAQSPNQTEWQRFCFWRMVGSVLSFF